MDNSLPVPFFGLNIEASDLTTCSGSCVDQKESTIIFNGFLFSANSYMDCHFSIPANRDKDKMHSMKLSFYIEKKSFLGNVTIEEDELKEQLNLFNKSPIYYLAILLKDNNQKTPLDYAIDKNSP